VPFGFELNRVLKVFLIELRAPHRGTSLGPFVCGARACSLCSFHIALGIEKDIFQP
jgi:hypothetical protein